MRSGNPLAAALAQSNDISNGLAAAFAPFSPLNTMQAGLLKAQSDLANTKAEVERGQLGLAQQKQPYEIREIEARTGAANSQAGYYQAGAREHDATTEQIKQQTKGLADMETAAVDAGAPPQLAAVFGAASRGSGRNTTVQQLMGAFNDTFRPDPVKLGQGETAFFAQGPQGQRLDPRAPLPVQSEPAPSMVPQTQLPFNQGGFGLPSGYQPQGAPMLPQQGVAPAPLAVGPTGNLAGAPVRSGNVVSIPGNAARSMTPGQKALDEAFANDYAQAIHSGSIADAEKQIVNLKSALANIQSGAAPVGPVVGRLPDWANQMTQDQNKGLVPTRNAIEDSVQRTLRAVLGGAFAQQEGLALIKRAFDPTVGKEETVRRIGLLVNSLESALQTRKSAIEHFKDQGSLIGWQGQLPSFGAIDASVDTKSGSTAPSSPAAGSQGDELVTVVSPSGQTGKIPKANLDAALKRGFKQK